MKLATRSLLALALAAGLATPAFAAEPGSWTVSLGAHVVDRSLAGVLEEK